MTTSERRRKIVLSDEDCSSCGTTEKRRLVVEEVCKRTEGPTIQHRIHIVGPMKAKSVIAVLLPAKALNAPVNHNVICHVSGGRVDNVVGISYCGHDSTVT
uniref:Uncharacterized protein n=1 Tax=Panagrolaimus superbus TaxID=310955 RepID=A0A914YWS7_9BILA